MQHTLNRGNKITVTDIFTAQNHTARRMILKASRLSLLSPQKLPARIFPCREQLFIICTPYLRALSVHNYTVKTYRKF